MKNFKQSSMKEMKDEIAKAGNLFYQYRPCNKKATIIHDVENIRHGVVYARTPLQMNDPFDSKIGFSVEEIYNECMDLALKEVDLQLDSNAKLLVKILLKYRIFGKTLEFIEVLNKLKKFIFTQSLISHVSDKNLRQFVENNLNKLYSKCPAEIKKYLSKEAFYIFALLVKDYRAIDIDEKILFGRLKIEEILKQLEDAVINARDKLYLPFLNEFLSKATVTCFSASGWDNQLMWSHYSNSYSGICVEYDFEKMNHFIGFMYPVSYSSVRPTISLKDLGIRQFKTDENGKLITDDVNVDAIFSYLLTKNKCWSYEHEWRLFNLEGKPDTPLFIDAPFVKSVTLGLNLDYISQQLIWDVCKEKDIACYQLIINNENYTLTRKELSDDDFVFDKEKEEAYIKYLCEDAVFLSQKISSSTSQLTNRLKEEKEEGLSFLNMLTLTLDYLSDVYFLKNAFNRFCCHEEVPLIDVTGESQIGTAIIQIDSFISQSAETVNMINDVLFDYLLSNKIISNEFNKTKKMIADIKSMIKKHSELKWYGN